MTDPQSPYYLPINDDSIDFKRYISLLLSNWYWFASALFIALSICYSINRWSEKIYTVTSSLLIKDDQLGGGNSGVMNIIPGAETFRSQQNLQNEIGILKSFNLNYKVMIELPEFLVDYIAVGKRGIVRSKMYTGCPFIVIYDSLEKQTIDQNISIIILSEQKYRLEINGKKNNTKELAFGERFTADGFDFKIVLRDKNNYKFDNKASNRYYFYFNSPFTLANLYRNKLSVIPIEEEATFVTLTKSGFVPDQEADYLNKLMQLYIQFGLDFKNLNAGQTIDFIEDQLALISDSLNVVEEKLENFRLANKFIDISREGIMIQQRLEKIDGEKTALQLQENYYKYLTEYIELRNENEDIVAPTVMGVTDQLLIGLVNELSLLQQERKKLSMNLSESVEPLKFFDAKIISTRTAIKENISSGLQTLGSIKADIDLRLKKVEQDIRRLPSTERQMITIQRKYDINNTVYTYLLEKRAEAKIAKASNVPDNIIIDHAGFYSTSLIKPQKLQNLIMALILGLLVPLLLIIVFDYINNKILDKYDIEKETDAPILGFINHNKLSTEMPVVENPGSTLSESFRSVRTNLKYFLKEVKSPVISVTSTITAEGKTFFSANLAAILAISGKKVLLVGLDLRKPRIHKIIGVKNDIGMSNFLIGEDKFENVVIKTNVENLWYAPSGPVPPNPAELIESSSMGEFIEKAKKRFDYIIIDTPPIAIVTDALLASPFTDFYIFVVRQRYSSKYTIRLIDELHKNENIKSLGIVINDINVSGYYGYGLRYGYSLGYGYSYGYNYYGDYSDRKYGDSDSSKGYYKEDV